MKEERYYGGVQIAPFTTRINSAANQWAGRTAVASGIATATVSTTSVKSDCLIFAMGQSAVASNVAQTILVNTISPGNFFTLGIDPAPVGTDFTICWRLDQGS